MASIMVVMMVLCMATSKVTLMEFQVVQNGVTKMIAMLNPVIVTEVVVEDLIASHVRVVDLEVVGEKAVTLRKG